MSLCKRLTLKKLLLIAIALLLFPISAPASAQSSCTADSPCELEVWIVFTDHRLDWAKERANEFMELHPEYTVTIVPQENYFTLLDAYALASDQGITPEISQISDIGTRFVLDAGYFKPVYEIIAGREEVLGHPVDFEDFIPLLSSYYTLDGEWASVPWNSSTPILYANMNLLRQVGLDAPLPTTWQELEAACVQLQPLVDDGTITGCFTAPLESWHFEQWLAQHNADLVNNGNGRDERATEVDLTSDAAIAIAQWHQDMYNSGYFVYTGSRDDTRGPLQVFSSQQAAFYISTSASAGSVTASAAETGVEVLTGRMPYNADFGWTGNIIGGGSMWITDGLEPEIEEGALAFLLFFSNTENAASWHQISGYVPVRQSAVDLLEEQDWYEQNPNFLVASQQLADGQVTSATRGAVLGPFTEIRHLISQALENAMLTGGDVTAIMAQAEEEANVLLEDYNLLFVGE